MPDKLPKMQNGETRWTPVPAAQSVFLFHEEYCDGSILCSYQSPNVGTFFCIDSNLTNLMFGSLSTHATGSQLLINQLRRFASSKVPIWIRRRGDIFLKQTGKDSCCLRTGYLFLRVSEGGLQVLARFKVKERLFGLR